MVAQLQKFFQCLQSQKSTLKYYAKTRVQKNIDSYIIIRDRKFTNNQSEVHMHVEGSSHTYFFTGGNPTY
jgi:hypothetical protein